MFHREHCFDSLDVESLFTSVFLIENNWYYITSHIHQKFDNNKIQEKENEECPKYCCTKGTLTLNGIIWAKYEQIDGLSMDHM